MLTEKFGYVDRHKIRRNHGDIIIVSEGFIKKRKKPPVYLNGDRTALYELSAILSGISGFIRKFCPNPFCGARP